MLLYMCILSKIGCCLKQKIVPFLNYCTSIRSFQGNTNSAFLRFLKPHVKFGFIRVMKGRFLV